MFDPDTASEEYLVAFRNAAHEFWEERKWRSINHELTCNVVLKSWIHLVEEAVDGYWMSYYEYANDLAIRELIQGLLENQHLMTFPEHSKFAHAVSVADKKLQAILVTQIRSEGGRYWWETSVPSYGSQEYVDSVPDEFVRFVTLRS